MAAQLLGRAAVEPTIGFDLLGPLTARRRGETVRIGRRRERCLLGLLLLDPGTQVPRDRLLDLLWDDDPPPTAAANLHIAVSRLRGVLHARFERGTVRLSSGSGGYGVDVDPELVDAHRFRRLVDAARALVDPGERIEALRTALALWRGPVLASDAWPRLRDRVGAEFVELRLHAASLLAQARLASGRHDESVVELTALTAEHPTHEPFVDQLMRALWRSGRAAEAVNAYDRCRRVLRDELGVRPAPQLQQLHVAILRGELVGARVTGVGVGTHPLR
jgi:DNA-binding SARP family transcriptional activator